MKRQATFGAIFLLFLLVCGLCAPRLHAAAPPVITILSPVTASVFRWPEDRFMVVADIESPVALDWAIVQFVHPQTGQLVGGTWSATGSMLNCRPEPCLQQTGPTTWRLRRNYDSVSMAAGLVGVQVLVQSAGEITRSSITMFLLSLTLPNICLAPIR